LRGLDALTTEDAIRKALNDLQPNVGIKNIRIAREQLTNVSSGFTFIEMNSILDANIIVDKLQPYFELDGKYVSINYSKNNYSTA
jgi:RNA recognition motif-containing protein